MTYGRRCACLGYTMRRELVHGQAIHVPRAEQLWSVISLNREGLLECSVQCFEHPTLAYRQPVMVVLGSVRPCHAERLGRLCSQNHENVVAKLVPFARSLRRVPDQCRAPASTVLRSKKSIAARQTASASSAGAAQAETANAVEAAEAHSFPSCLKSHGLDPVLKRREVTTVQVNIGLYCNQACAHCHVDSSPARTEMMDRPTAARIVELIAASDSVHTVDLTGGAPELNPQFRFLVEESRRLGKNVIDRCNLTVLFEPAQEDLADFLKENQVRVVASLPCYSSSNVDKQRGKGVFDKSIAALKLLNSLGYGQEGSGLLLDLVYNPVGPTLPPSQAKLQPAYESELWDCYGIRFNSLLTIANMPINRYKKDLEVQGTLDDYMQLLLTAFNPAAVPNVMCTNLINIRWDGALFDCDFNQQLDLKPLQLGLAPTVFTIGSLEELLSKPVILGSHCFGCTAGQGSSCGGALAAA